MSFDPLDLQSLLYAVAESHAGAFRIADLAARFGGGIEQLVRLGALSNDAPSKIVTCRACDEDHVAEVEFDPTSRRYTSFCPTAGRVDVPATDVQTCRFEVEWLISALASALHMGKLRPLSLARDRIWKLGRLTIGSLPVDVVFARHLAGDGGFDALAAALEDQRPATVGLVLTTTRTLPRRAALPHGYRVVDLFEVVAIGPNGLAADDVALADWCSTSKGRRRSPQRGRAGRPTQRTAILAIRRERIAAGVALQSKTREAEAIRDELARGGPGDRSPAVKTILKILQSVSS